MMKLSFAAILCAAVTTHSSAILAATASVEFVDADKFTDVARNPLGSERDAYLASLRRHLVEAAARSLPADQALTVSVTDVDRAGQYEPGRIDDIRVVRDLYPPRIDLKFRLARADGSTIKEGERKLRDAGFMMTANSTSSDPMKFEKALLDQWLRREFR